MKLSSITRDLTLKVFSLVIASVLFVFVGVESATPVDVEFHIDYRTADDMMLTGDPPTTVQTTLEGPWANLRSFDINSLPPVVVDLTGAEPSTLRHRIDTSDVQAPGGMKVVAMRPSELELTLDRRVERLLEVAPDIVERPAFGYTIVETRVEPKQVRVVGPMTRVRTLDFVSTRPIDVSGREDDVAVEVDLRPPSPGIKLLDKRVKVLIEINEESVTRTFQAMKVLLDNAPRGTKVAPDNVAVSIKGPRRFVDALPSKPTFEIYVDALPELEEGLALYEKTIVLRGGPERTILVMPIPKVTLQIPKSALHKKKGK
jgi:YbbR domain-containing protein